MNSPWSNGPVILHTDHVLEVLQALPATKSPALAVKRLEEVPLPLGGG